MIRRVINSVLEPTIQNSLETCSSPFTKPETVPFAWLTSVTPCFPVSAKNIAVLTSPSQFYVALLDNSKRATKRIVLASLYIGTGSLENKLVEALKGNFNLKRGNLKIDILLDYHRGSRSQVNSRTILKPLLEENEKNCTVSLYHTPTMRGVKKKLIPDRWNELAGLQHMKLYIFDDTLIISGANLSNDYFTNRQDRYYLIKDKHLCDFYQGLVNTVQKFSLKLDKNNNVGLAEDWDILPYESKKDNFVEKAGGLIEDYIEGSKCEQNTHKREGFDTWIFPLVQMGQLGIQQDSQVTDRIFSEAGPGSKLCISTGYFNLTSQYIKTLIEKSQAKCEILMAHPQANGFLGAKGAAGGIPYAYSLIANNFKKLYEKCGQQHRIILLEYLKQGWTFHGKGLWYYPPEVSYPCSTLIGSPNFGGRSVTKDLETQIAIITENEELKKQLHQECLHLYKQGLPAETDRKVPNWVYAFVLLFKNYF